MIGGATTSAKHTAVKIAPQYAGPTVHVLDASRAVGVVEKAISPDQRPQLEIDNRKLQAELVASYEKRQQGTLVSYADARARRFSTDWAKVDIPKPARLGPQVLREIPLVEIAPYIDWSPFFQTWELKGKYPAILTDATYGEAASKLLEDAQEMLGKIIAGRWLTANAVYGFWPAAADGDDIVLFTPPTLARSASEGSGSTLARSASEAPHTELARLHTLRQQWQRQGQDTFRALADYIAPLGSGREDYVGAFAVTTGLGCAERAAEFERQHDDYSSIMLKALADRLAEALAEKLHAQARAEWGFGAAEKLSHDDLIEERYRGIRPAPGYPAQPDHTEKRTIFDLLDAERAAGITLTESYAMLPAASVSGLYFAHPQARYFAVDRVTKDQVEDYAKRKGMPLSEVERWLSPNLGYEP